MTAPIQDNTRIQFHRALQEAKQELKQRQKEINKIGKKKLLKDRLVQLYITGAYTNKEIASMLGVTVGSVNHFLTCDDEIRDMIISYQDKERELVNTRLQAMRTKALERMDELLEDEDSNVRLSAVKDVLDRTGHKAKDQKDVNINISYEERLQELSQTVDTSFLDAEFTEIEEDVTCDTKQKLIGKE